MGSTNSVVGSVSLNSQTTMLLAGRGQASSLAVLVHRIHDPVDSWIVTNGNVLWINHDDFEVLVGGVLVNPVGVQYTQIGTYTTSTLLCNASQVSYELQLVDTSVLWLAVDNALRIRTLPATATNTNAIDNKALWSQ